MFHIAFVQVIICEIIVHLLVIVQNKKCLPKACFPLGLKPKYDIQFSPSQISFMFMATNSLICYQHENIRWRAQIVKVSCNILCAPVSAPQPLSLSSKHWRPQPCLKQPQPWSSLCFRDLVLHPCKKSRESYFFFIYFTVMIKLKNVRCL